MAGPIRGLNDYDASLPQRMLPSQGRAGQGQEMGPIAWPVEPAPTKLTQLNLLLAILQALKTMPHEIFIEARRQLMIPSREAIWFNASSGFVTIAAGATAIVVTQVVDERATGALEAIGLNCVPIGAMTNQRWSLVIDNGIHPKFGERTFTEDTVGRPRAFRQELIQSRTISITCRNTAAVPVQVAAVLIGWHEYMSDQKAYGSSSASGF